MRILVGPHLVFATIAGLALPARPVRAEPHQMCLYLDIGGDYWDASPRAADGEDFREEYGRNEGPTSFPAQRWLARVRDEGNDEIVFGWRPLDGNGCASFELPGGETELTMEWMRWAVWNEEVETGNQLVGYRCDAVMTNCDLVPEQRTLPANMVTGVTEIILEPFPGVSEIDLVFWAATFAEERFASMGEQPLDDTRIYVGYDPQNILPGKTQADRTFGNQPSVVVAGESWRSKFTIAHELGHQQTIAASQAAFGEADLDYCYDPAAYPMAPTGCPSDHVMTSHEWQAVAAVEGIASSPCSRRSTPRATGTPTSPATPSGRASTRRWRCTWERTMRPGRRPRCRWSSTDDEADPTDRSSRRAGSAHRLW